MSERHECWPGLAYILEHGYPDMPPAIVREWNPRAEENKLNQRRYRARKTLEAGEV